MKTRHVVFVLMVLVAVIAGCMWFTRPDMSDAQTSRGSTFTDQWLRANVAASSDGYSLKVEYTPPDTLTKDFATTNTVETIQTLTRTSSGTPAAGIGGSLDLGSETAAGNNEVGLTLEAVTTDVTSTSEDFDAVLGLMDAGAAVAERWRVDSGGVVTQSAESAATNAVIDVMNIKHGTSGTEANGIGLGIIFTQEVTSGDEIAGNFDVVATDVTAASEDFSYIWSLMAAGAAASQVMELQSTGILELAGAATLDNSTAATELNITETNIQLTGALNVEGGNVIFNNDSGDYDFTIESDDVADALVVDGADNTIKANTGVYFKAVTADPCSGAGFGEGAIFYNDTGNILCFCDGTNDLKIADGAACF